LGGAVNNTFGVKTNPLRLNPTSPAALDRKGFPCRAPYSEGSVLGFISLVAIWKVFIIFEQDLYIFILHWTSLNYMAALREQLSSTQLSLKTAPTVCLQSQHPTCLPNSEKFCLLESLFKILLQIRFFAGANFKRQVSYRKDESVHRGGMYRKTFRKC
jgi:hypothetical protein